MWREIGFSTNILGPFTWHCESGFTSRLESVFSSESACWLHLMALSSNRIPIESRFSAHVNGTIRITVAM